MIVEGRTITNLAELQEFCEAPAAAAHADPATVRLHTPQNMRVTEVTRPDGAKVYDVSVSSAA